MHPSTRSWYGSCEKDDYRLLDTDSEEDENQLWKVCEELARKPPITEFRGLEYLDSGWEWSVFRDGNYVIKIPAGRFPEVGDQLYIANAEINQREILRHVPERFVAVTTFHPGFLRQEWINTRHIDTVNLREVDQPIRKELIQLFSGLLSLLRTEDWLPDLDIEPKNGVIQMKNWLLDHNGVPKIVDFTSYYDVFRLSERRLRRELPVRERWLMEAMELLM